MTRISVGVRLKPEESANVSKNLIVSREHPNSIDISLSGTKHEFQFDDIFMGNSTQDNVFKQSTNNIIDDVLEGFNGCVLTYGQTGAGKTYSMTGPSSENYEERGLVMRTASAIFNKCAGITDSITVRLSVLEIYNETLIDLLREQSPGNAVPSAANSAPKLTIIEGSSGISIPALYILPISCEEDAFSILLEAYGNRVVGEHQLNRKSSRSHVIYTFYVTRTRAEDDIVQSKLNLVDLAGSERVQKTGSSGIVQKEASYINKSLSFLEQVVLALSQSKRDHIPYRQSKLTYLLKDSLGGNCATYLIACIWPHQLHEWESLSTLRFATRMKCIENHPIRNSLVSKEPLSSRLLQQIEQLKRELIMRDTMNNIEPWLPELTKAQKIKSLRSASAVALTNANLKLPSSSSETLATMAAMDAISPSQEEIDINSLSQCRFMLGFLRKCLWESCDGESSRVQSIVDAMATSFGSQSILATAVQNSNSMDGLHRGHGGYIDNMRNVSLESPVGKKVPIDKALVISMNENMEAVESEQLSVAKLSFDEYSQGPGKRQFESYVTAKEALKSNKSRQKEIVSILNSRKAQIDQLVDSLREAEEGGNMLIEDMQVIEKRLELSKQEYRAAFGELQLCKKQVSELETLKQRAQAVLLKAFEEYSSSTS